MCAALGVFEHNLESPDRKSYQSSVICYEFLEFSEIHLKLELERKKRTRTSKYSMNDESQISDNQQICLLT